MGLKVKTGLIYVRVAFLLAMTGCTAKSVVTPADRASNQTWYTDCCDPGLSEGDKELCGYAAKDEDHTRWDSDGNRYVYVWSDCKVGGEPWRKWE